MKQLGLPWVAFWIGLFSFLIAALYFTFTHPFKDTSPEAICVQNGGIPIHSGWANGMIDCKIYKK